MKADEQIYSMRTLKQQEMINRRKKTKIMIILIGWLKCQYRNTGQLITIM